MASMTPQEVLRSVRITNLPAEDAIALLMEKGHVVSRVLREFDSGVPKDHVIREAVAWNRSEGRWEWELVISDGPSPDGVYPLPPLPDGIPAEFAKDHPAGRVNRGQAIRRWFESVARYQLDKVTSPAALIYDYFGLITYAQGGLHQVVGFVMTADDSQPAPATRAFACGGIILGIWDKSSQRKIPLEQFVEQIHQNPTGINLAEFSFLALEPNFHRDGWVEVLIPTGPLANVLSRPDQDVRKSFWAIDHLPAEQSRVQPGEAGFLYGACLDWTNEENDLAFQSP